MLQYKDNYKIYSITLALSIAILLGWFKFITEFKFESLPILSVKNIAAAGMFYLAYRIYINQVDYY